MTTSKEYQVSTLLKRLSDAEHEMAHLRKKLDLVFDLWYFIEEVPENASDRQERFFALRERVRELQVAP